MVCSCRKMRVQMCEVFVLMKLRRALFSHGGVCLCM